MIFNFSFCIEILSLALVVNGSEKIKCDYCHSIERVTSIIFDRRFLKEVTHFHGGNFTLNKVFSDGIIESHDGSGQPGSDCIYGSQQMETQGDGRDGQCKTVYVVYWLANTRDQV